MLLDLLFALLSLPGRARRWWSPPPVPPAVVRLRARVVAELLAVGHLDAALRVGSARTVAEIAAAAHPSRSWLSPELRAVLWPHEGRPS